MFWGNLADRWLRQGVYLIGVALIAVLSPLFTVTVLLPVIIGLRFLQGVGFSGSSTAGAAMSADLIPASRRAEGVGYYTLANTIGMAFGPALGLGVLQSFGPAWLFATSVTSGAVAFGLGLFLRYERTRHHAASAVEDEVLSPADPMAAEPSSTIPVHAASPSPKKSNRFVEPTVLPTSVVFLFVIIPYGAIMAFIAAYGLEQGVTQIGLYFTVFAVALFGVRLVIGRISDKHGVTVAFVPAIIAMAAGLVVLWWADSLPVFLLSAVLFGLGFGIALPLLQATAYTFAPAERRGAASATFFATADIAYGVGAMLLGVAMSLFDHRVAFAGLAIFTLLALVAFFTVLRPRLLAVGRS
jgi:MFS family permease